MALSNLLYLAMGFVIIIGLLLLVYVIVKRKSKILSIITILSMILAIVIINPPISGGTSHRYYCIISCYQNESGDYEIILPIPLDSSKNNILDTGNYLLMSGHINKMKIVDTNYGKGLSITANCNFSLKFEGGKSGPYLSLADKSDFEYCYIFSSKNETRIGFHYESYVTNYYNRLYGNQLWTSGCSYTYQIINPILVEGWSLYEMYYEGVCFD